MDDSSILYHTHDCVAVIRFNRPEALNALTVEVMWAITAAIERATQDPAMAAIVVSGVGRGFLAGANLVEAQANPVLDDESRVDLCALVDRCYRSSILGMRNPPKPVIVAVNGVAVGMAGSLAPSADLTIAARSTSFLLAFINIDVIPNTGGTQQRLEALGIQRAIRMVLLDESLSAQQVLSQ